MSNQPNNIYLDINVSNNRETFFAGSTEGYPLRFTEQRTDPIIDRPDLYDMAVSRFSIPMTSTPLMLIPIENGQTGINDTTWFVTLKHGATYYQKRVIHETTQFGVPTPQVNTLMTDEVQYKYYLYYSYYAIDEFLYIVNKALAAAFALIPSGGITSTAPPKFIFNYQTQLFTIYYQYSYLADGIKIFLNDPLYNKFDGISSLFYKTAPYQNCDFELNLTVQPENYFVPNGFATPAGSTGTTPTPPIYLALTQNFVMVPTLSSVKKIQFVTTMPVLRENIASGFDSTNKSISVLTDFLVTFENTVSRQDQNYFPTLYRWISLTTNSPLYRIDFSVFWVDTKGNIYPIYLPPKSTANIKLYFRKKTSDIIEK